MSLVNFPTNKWKIVADALKSHIQVQEYHITQIKHRILRMPIQRIEKEGSLDEKVADLKKTIVADCAYKEKHPESDVQNNRPYELLVTLRDRLFEYEKTIEDTKELIKTLNEMLERVKKAAKIPSEAKEEKTPFTGDWGIFTEEEKKTWANID